MVTDEEVKKLISGYEISAGMTFPKEARVLPFLKYPDVRKCYPFCDSSTDILMI